MKSWIILNYHNISWKETPWERGLGSCFPPDIFREHIEVLANMGSFVSIVEGIEKVKLGKTKHPFFSFWFDDGMSGLTRYALPILREFNITAAVSICSRFVKQTEYFWRMKLSYLSFIDGLRFLRSRLKKYGFKIGESIKSFTLDNFSLDLIDEIDSVYCRFASSEVRNLGWSIFETEKGISKLRQYGWLIANHSAAHYPVGEDCCIHLFNDQFEECKQLVTVLNKESSPFLVIPFDRPQYRSARLYEVFSKRKKDEWLVLVGDRANDLDNVLHNTLYRVHVPKVRGKQLMNMLKKL